MRYEDFHLDHPKLWCWACGTDKEPLERAHLMAGSGKGLRLEDPRAVNLLCPQCHRLHTHWGDSLLGLSNSNMLWLKRERDPEHYDPAFIRSFWIGDPPELFEPIWIRGTYNSRRGLHDG